MTIEERGPWAAGETDEKPRSRTYIESDDFTHDVRLYVTGDFESPEQRAEYAKEIARRLNAFDEIERMRKELDGVRERCASIARRMNAPEVAGAISGDGK